MSMSMSMSMPMVAGPPDVFGRSALLLVERSHRGERQ
jgi:hypothetical protein